MEKLGKYNINKVFERIYHLSDDPHNIHTPLELCDQMLDRIPELGGDILVMFNLEFIYQIKKRINNLNRVWFITPCGKKALVAEGMGIERNHIRYYSYKDKEIKEIETMPKFDVVVGNPPYMRNTHLKFLELAVNSLKADGKIVWIHPARWLQDPLAPMKKGSDFMKYRGLPFQDFKLIPVGEASKMFGNEMTADLVISYLENGGISILDEQKIYELRGIPKSLSKIIHRIKKSLKDVAELNKSNGIRVRMKTIIQDGHGRSAGPGSYDLYPKEEIIIDGKVNGIFWTENIQKNQYIKEEGMPIPLSIQFNTVEEAKNFIDSTNTDFFLFLNYLTKLDVNVQLKYLPFMEDYKEPWTNERFAEHFGISDDEMEFIKETIKKYKKS